MDRSRAFASVSNLKFIAHDILIMRLHSTVHEFNLYAYTILEP